MDWQKIAIRVLDVLIRLLGGDKPKHEPTGETPGTGEPPGPIHRKVSLIIYDPVIESEGGRRLTQVLGWNDADRLVEGFIADLKEVSRGQAEYEITERLLVDEFPVKQDGFQYTGEAFVRSWRTRTGFHSPDAVDYDSIVRTHCLEEKVRDGLIDEVWTISFPYAGFYESRMAGPGAFWCNAPALEGYEGAGRRFIIMGFNYERGVGEMLESYAHRVESIMNHAYRKTSGADNLWKRFIQYDQTHPGQAEVGTVHFAPNSLRDYDWGNPAPVPTRCRNWDKFPDLSGEPVIADSREWGSGDIREHHRWWLRLLPHISGTINGVSTNWWEYIIVPDRVR